MASANAKLVMGWPLNRLCEIGLVDGPQKYDPDTGQPVPKQKVDALFILGKQVDHPEFYPGEWSKELEMEVFSCGDGSENYPGTGLRAYNLEMFVAGVKVAGTDDDHGAVAEVSADLPKFEMAAVLAMKKLCKKLGVDFDTAVPKPFLHLVCYYSY